MSERIVEVADERGSLPLEVLRELEAVALWTLDQEGVGDAEISVALVSDDTIAALNRDYLSHEGPTDVISFPLDDLPDRVVGDIYLGVEQAGRQAQEVGVPQLEELLRLTVHGVLHVLGWDHPDDESERAGSPMYRRQEELLAGWMGRQR
ncbi:MAG TPA: rRNA maturation RNase YbeY [Longimicrobiaceae bacterium]|nr:rRNA maturation RNase YbeY [Longimicrobiaceae bacterium]